MPPLLAEDDQTISKALAGLALVFIFASFAQAGLGAPSKSSSPHKAVVSSSAGLTMPLTLQKGVPLSIALAQRVRIGRKGNAVEGRLVQPIYAFDRQVAPAGALVLGRIASIQPEPRLERARAIMHGNFAPTRTARFEFNTLVLASGRRIPIQTRVSQGTVNVVHLEVAGQQKAKHKNLVSRMVGNARRQFKQEKKQVVAGIRQPGFLHRAKELMISELPYHPQYLPAGTRFTAALEQPVRLGSVQVPASELKLLGKAPPPFSTVYAALLTPLSSATAHRGTPVVALVMRPIFSKEHELVIPEGSKIEGTVVQAQPARRMALHRRGVLRFTCRRIQTPHGVSRPVVGSLKAVSVARKENVKLDSEGGAHATTPKLAYAAPAIAVLIAATSAMPDTDVRTGRIYQDTSGPATGQIIGGGLGYRFIGMAMALGIHYQPVTAGLAAYGAAWSLYSLFVSRGQNVVFPRDTRMEIQLGRRVDPRVHHSVPHPVGK